MIIFEPPTVDRVARPWLVDRFVDREAEFRDGDDRRRVDALHEVVRSLPFPSNQEQRRASKATLDALSACC